MFLILSGLYWVVLVNRDKNCAGPLSNLPSLMVVSAFNVDSVINVTHMGCGINPSTLTSCIRRSSTLGTKNKASKSIPAAMQALDW